ncbi:hypothetical protein HP550_17985 [Cellulomonas humilata]|uniref:IPT/TIG domain-containing protein n=1 Tax=Cellulomonas humilata TaxID=144055 RepID=A0A7Y6A5Q9_9CELL|nr:hypothetical protein [Cellulomonas humilata]
MTLARAGRTFTTVVTALVVTSLLGAAPAGAGPLGTAVEDAPAVTGLSPAVVARGSALTIAGTGFSETPGGNAVSINGVPAVVTAQTSTAVTVTVPTTATTGPVVVQTSTGTAESPTDTTIPPTGFTVAQTLPASRLTSGVASTARVAVVDQVAVLTLPLQTTDRLAVRLTGSTFGSSTSKARVSILRPDGTALVAATGFGSAALWLDARAVPAVGTYTVLIDPQGTAVGEVQVEAFRVPVDATADLVPGGSPVTVTTTVPGQNAVATVAATAGQTVAFTLSAATLATPTAATVRLVGPDGSVVLAPVSLPSAGVFLDAVTLPVAGTYSLVVDAAGAQTGAVTVRAHDVPTGPAQQASTDGTPVLASATTPGQNPVVTFPHTGGRFAVDLSASTFGSSTSSARVSVLGPDGATLVAPVGFGTAGKFLDVRTLDATGDVRVVVDPAGALLGGVTVRVWAVPADPTAVAPLDGTAVDLTTTTPGQNAAATFTATVGSRVSLSARTAASTVTALVSVVGPTGATVVAPVTASTSGTFVEPFTIATAGVHRIVVDPTGTTTGTVTLRASAVVDDTRALALDGTATTVAVPVPGSVSRLVTHAEAGERLSVSLTASTFGSSAAKVSATGPGGVVLVAARSFSAAGTFLDTFAVPASGDVTLTIDPVGAAVGQVDVAGWRVPAELVLEGAVGAEPVTVATGTPGQGGRLGFTGAVGQKVALRLTASTFGSSTASARVSVLRPDGTTLVAATGFGTAGVFVDQLQLTLAGRYEVVVDPQGTATGQVAVELVDLDGQVVDATLDGTPVTVATTDAGQNARIRFAGVAGQRVAVKVTSSSYGSTSTLRLTLTDGAGTVVLPTTGVATGTFVEPRTLTTDGVHTLTVDPQGTAVGSVTLELVPVPQDDVVAAAADGTPITFTVGTPGQNSIAELTGTAGQVVSLVVAGSTFGSSTANLRVSLLAPDGTAVVAATGVGSSGLFVDARALPQTGVYRVLVDPQAAAVGSVRVTVHPVPDVVPVALVADGDPVTLVTGTPGQGAAAEVEGAAGGLLALRFTGGTFASAKVSVLRPDGTTLVAATTLGSALFVDTLELVQPGIYRVVVDPQAAATGQVTIEAFHVDPDVVVPATADGTATTVATTLGQDARVTFDAAAGSRASVQLTASTYGSSTGSARVSLLAPDGTVLATATGFGTAGTFVEPRALAVSGTYTVLVDPQGGAVGSVDVAVFDVPADVVQPIEAGGPVAVTTVVAPGQNVVLETTLPAAVPARLRVFDGPASARVTVRGPTGTTLVTRTVSTSGSVLAFTPTVAGTHTVTIDPTGVAVGSWSAELYGAVGTPVLTAYPSEPWITTGEVDVYWSVDAAGTIAGYAVAVDASPTTDPGTTVEEDLTTSRHLSLADGEHWVHVRAVLADGTASNVAHLRVGVDTVAPELGALRSPTHPAGVVSTQRDVTVEWDAPDDTSGIAGYDVRVTRDELPPAPPVASLFRAPLVVDADHEGVDTTETTAVLPLSDDGEWFVHVRAQDLAGHWSQFSTYAVAVDSTAPSAPEVAGSHTQDVPTSQRHVVATFSAAEQDHVEAWAAVLDASPTTVPDPALARTEARLATTVEPGTWWLHVVGKDTLGRWGATRHVRLVVSDDPYVLDVPAGRHLWSPTTVVTTCPAGAGVGLGVVTADGPAVRVADLVGSGTCSGTWDVTATADDMRTWPDGDYQLVVVDATGAEVSERVAVTVDAAATTTQRLQADHAAGLLTADQLARLLLQATIDPVALPEQYRTGAVADTPSSADLVGALTAGGTISDELADLLTPVDETPVAGRAMRGANVTACGKVIRFLDILFDCIAVSDNFVVHYESDQVGETEDGGTSSEFVTMIVDGLERARQVYQSEGFRVPDYKVNAYLSQYMQEGAGISLPRIPRAFGHTPAAIIMDSDPTEVTEYLPHHEFFHQVEYQYVSAARVANPVNNPYWWMEASAEWGAHLVQSSVPGLTQRSSYAISLDDFVERSRLPFDAGDLASARGPEYGAFVMAEFLDEQYGGPSAVEKSWAEIDDWPFGRSPASAFEEVAKGGGDSYAEAIDEFRQKMYALGYDEGVGFVDEDAQPGGIWRSRLGADTRPPTTTLQLTGTVTSGSGSIRLAAGGAEYVEVTKPAGVTGELDVSVHGPDGTTYASVLGVSDYPDLCAGPREVSRGDEDGSVSVTLDDACPTAVLVLTNTGKVPSPTVALMPRGTSEFTWDVAFAPRGAQLSNGTIDIGVTRLGSVILDDLGLRRADSPETEVLAQGCACEAWGIGNQWDHGSVDSQGSASNVTLRSFQADADSAEIVTSTGDLRVTHEYEPSSDDDLYAVNVTVERTGALVNSDHVTYRRAVDFDVAPTPFDEYVTWAKTSDGDDSNVVVLTNDGFAYADPTSAATSLGSVGYVDRYGPTDQGGLIDLDLGPVRPGSPVTFTLYFGVALDADEARASVEGVGADVYLLGEPSSELSTNTAVFAFRAGDMGDGPIEARTMPRGLRSESPAPAPTVGRGTAPVQQGGGAP